MALQVWLPLNGNINNQGLSGITMTGSPNSWGSNGKIGKCATFTGSTSNVIYNNTTDFNYTDNFSYCMWINHNYTGTATQFVFTNGRADAGGYGYGIQIVNTSNIKCWFGNRSISISCPANEWHHIAFTISGTTIKVYKDGLLYSTNTTAKLPTYSDGNGLGIGCFHYTGNVYPYYGSLNDFRIYDHCLSAKEVSEIAKGLILHYPLNNGGFGGENLFINGYEREFDLSTPAGTSTRYSSASIQIQVSIGDYTPGDIYTWSYDIMYTEYSGFKVGEHWIGQRYLNSGTVLQAWQGVTQSAIPLPSITGLNQWYHHSTSIKIPTSNYPQPNNSTQCSIQFSNSATTAGTLKFKMKNIKLEKSPIATPWIPNSADTLYSTMGLNTIIEHDCSGFGNNGIKSGAIACESDSPRYMTSYKFNGNSCIKNNQFYFESPIWTVSLWYKYNTAPTAYEGLICLSKNDGSDSNKKIAIMANSNQIWFKTENISMSIPSLKVGEWCHLAAVSDGTSAIIYENGVRKASTTISSFVTKAYDLVVGARASSAGATTTSFYSKGNISDVRIYATALSADAIKQLYNTPISVDKSGNLYAYEFKEG